MKPNKVNINLQENEKDLETEFDEHEYEILKLNKVIGKVEIIAKSIKQNQNEY